jgi:peptide/nickel transport system substrate-binding protein
MRTSASRLPGLVPCLWLGLVAISFAACDLNPSSQHRLSGGTASFAEGPNARPNYIFPLTSAAYFSATNVSQFQSLMYRPLYWFGQSGQVALNSSLSLAGDPAYSSDGKTVTMKLKGWKWSDGTLITSRDVEFWMNLLKANTDHWAAYSRGEFPDNVKTMTFPDSQTIVFGLDKAYGDLFFTYNQLSQITPIPQHLWDKTSDTGAIGDNDRDPTTAKAVVKYLDAQSRSVETYGTNPLWRVVSGPWRLKSMTTGGRVAMVPNPGYSGPVKPAIAEFDLLPYATDSAELNDVQAGGVDYGYIPSQNVDQANSLKNDALAPWIGWSIGFIQLNFNNQLNGPIYRQLYFRSAMQHLVDQQTWIKKILKGNGYPDYGPVPIKPANNFADAIEQANPYPYDPVSAIKLLADNGWTVNIGGASTCSKPGIGAGKCGANIAAGAKASFKLEYVSGSVSLKQEMEALKTAFALAGLEVNLSEVPFETVIGDAFSGSTTADMSNWGYGWIFAPDYYPTGDQIFSTGAGSNGGGYTSAVNDANTTETMTSNGVTALYPYEDFLAKDIPVIWNPVADYQLSMVKNTLQGWGPQDPLLQIYPENWYFTSP